jgi:hypothetical protein
MVAEEPAARKRRRRGRRGAANAPVAATTTTSGGLPTWLTYPVVLAFAIGIIVMGVAYNTPLRFPVFVIGLLGLGLVLSHFTLTRLASRRR